MKRPPTVAELAAMTCRIGDMPLPIEAQYLLGELYVAIKALETGDLSAEPAGEYFASRVAGEGMSTDENYARVLSVERDDPELVGLLKFFDDPRNIASFVMVSLALALLAAWWLA